MKADTPAAWTTSPRVVVILEEATLADSGSKPKQTITLKNEIKIPLRWFLKSKQ